MIVLGLHKDPWHNTCACLIWDTVDGPKIVQIAQERLDRVKDSRAFPMDAVNECLGEAGLSGTHDIDHVVVDYIIDRDWKKDEAGTPCLKGTFLDSHKSVEVINHHEAHANAVYYSSGFDKTAILIVDGRGSNMESQSLFVVDEWGLRLIDKSDCVGLGMIYETVTMQIGFGLLQEGKTMGLAPYGGKHCRILDFWGRYSGIVTDYSRYVKPGTYDPVDPIPLVTFDQKAQAAYDVQEELEFGMMHLARHARERTGLDHLCISGGVGLNSVANEKIRKAGLFKGLFINPAASDTGIALGCALYGWHRHGGKRLKFGPYLGPNYTFEDYHFATRGLNPAGGFGEAVAMLAANKIVAYFEGRSEMGPRALGHRSILMSPMVAENKDRLNRRVKHREGFRPFAPAVPLERCSEYFDLDEPSPYMLLVPEVLPNKRSVIPAVTHVDGTARVQTLTKADNGEFYDLTHAFGMATGVPVLLNTSFNVAGEPMVESPMDAVKCFRGTDIDALYMGGQLFTK